jgi:hypothetical protein
MSPFARGLLGGVAEGITDTASLLFQDAIAAKKEERLAKIADRNYLRDRKDTLSDIEAQRTFQRGLLEEERGYLDSVREIEAGYVTSTQLDDDGNLRGITRSGTLVDLGQLATVDPLLRPSLESLKLAQSDAARINLEKREENTLVWDALETARNQFNQALEDSRVRLGRSNPPPDLPSPEQIKADGRKLFGADGMGTGITSVEFDGVTYSGSQLDQLRKRFRSNYGDYYGQLYGQ